MKNAVVFFALAAFACVANADLDLAHSKCEIEMMQIGKGQSTPLHKEAEWVLAAKGYTMVPAASAEERSSAQWKASPFQVRYSAGNESPSGESDCILEDYHELGKRWTCQYELQFFVTDPQGEAQKVYHLRQSIRQSLDERGFFDRVRSQLAQIPQCTNL